MMKLKELVKTWESSLHYFFNKKYVMRLKLCSEIKNIMNFPATKIIVLLCLLLGFTNLAIANTYDSIEYNLNLINIKDSLSKVEIILRGKFKNNLVLDLPSKWAGSTYIDQIKNIEVNPNPSVELKQENNNSQAIISIPKISIIKATPENGLYKSFDFKNYFEEPSRKAYLVKIYDEIAGFVLLNQATEDATNTWNMGKFFIIAKFQGAAKDLLAAEEFFFVSLGENKQGFDEHLRCILQQQPADVA